VEKPTQQQIEQARNRIKEYAREARTDPNMVQRLRSDPMGTLTAAGVPEFAVGDFLREEGTEADVSGFAAAGCAISCVCTSCCVSLRAA
jgi:hypothetical protein